MMFSYSLVPLNSFLITTPNRSISPFKCVIKNFQDPTMDLLDPIVQIMTWCPYFASETLQFSHKELLSGMDKTASWEL